MRGGAICAVVDLSMKFCLFHVNSASSAGSVFCSGSCEMSKVTFSGGFSPFASGFMTGLGGCRVSLVTFSDLVADDTVAFSHDSGGPLSVEFCNLSTLLADDSRALFAACGCSVAVRGCHVFDAHALRDCGVALTSCDGSVTQTMFRELAQRTGAAALSTDRAMSMTGCSFFNCVVGNGTLLKGAVSLVESCSTGPLQEVGDVWALGDLRGRDSCEEFFVAATWERAGHVPRVVRASDARRELAEAIIIAAGMVGLSMALTLACSRQILILLGASEPE